MKKIIRNGIFLIPFFILIVSVSASPVLPAEYYGSVVINGNPAPAGTEISAFINDLVVGNITITSAGSYGGTGTFDPKLVISGTDDGETIVFVINGKQADQTSIFHPGDFRQLSLTIALGSPTATTSPTITTSPTATTSPTTTTSPTVTTSPTTTTSPTATTSPTTTTSPTATTATAITSASQMTQTTSISGQTPSTTTRKSTPTVNGEQQNSPVTTGTGEKSSAGSGQTSTIPPRKSGTVITTDTAQSSETQASGFSVFDTVGILLLVAISAVILRK